MDGWMEGRREGEQERGCVKCERGRIKCERFGGRRRTLGRWSAVARGGKFSGKVLGYRELAYLRRRELGTGVVGGRVNMEVAPKCAKTSSETKKRSPMRLSISVKETHCQCQKRSSVCQERLRIIVKRDLVQYESGAQDCKDLSSPEIGSFI